MILGDIVKNTKRKIGKGIFFGMTLFALNNCNFTLEEMHDWYKIPKSEMPKKLKNHVKKDINSGEYFFEFGSGDNIHREKLGNYIVKWVTDEIYPEFYAYRFQPARITLKEKKGNCARRAVLILALAYNLTDKKEKGELILCWSSNPEASGMHYCTRINGDYNEKYIDKVYEVIPFTKIGKYIYYKQ